LLYVRFSTPGIRATVYPGGGQAKELITPATVGFRPGYIYRVQLSGFPDHPGVSLYPTLEVRGTLQLPPKQRAADYPAPLVLTPEDVNQALAGSLVTKVIYLENPDLAPPIATSADQPLERETRPSDDLLEEARALGRPMFILRLGGRAFSPDEMMRQAIPGTVLLPDQQGLSMPPVRPYVPWANWPIYDPYLGPRHAEEECLNDGGDIGRPAGFDREGRLLGLDPSDTVAEYKDSHGGRHISPSNRICICVPRFAVLRTATPPAGYEVAMTLGGAQGLQERAQIKTRVPSRETEQNEQLQGVRVRERPTVNIGTQGLDRLVQLEVLSAYNIEVGPAVALGTQALRLLTAEQRARLTRQVEFAQRLIQTYGTLTVGQVTGPAVVGQIQGVKVMTALQETRDYTCVCNEVPHVPDKPLVLCKWTDAQSAKVGDIVTFFLKYSNQGGRPITDVAVSDSLTGRLEYVPGSSKSDRDAVFTMQENSAGSLVLRWEISGRLLAGQTGIVSFQAKIR
jgi:uncharacterized repeat protein (TIGR01451 family)